MPRKSDSSALQKESLVASHEENVFIMMRYRDDARFIQIEKTIQNTLTLYDLKAQFAKSIAYAEDVWNNIIFYMNNSKYGLAVFEEINEREYNPNISMELGYMYALGRRCLLLKDKRMPLLPTDICGKIYKDFDTYDIENSIRSRIKEWCEFDLGIERRLNLRAEPISDLSESEATVMIKRYNFFDRNKHMSGKGIKHRYQVVPKKNGVVAVDFTTKLTWQQSGSDEFTTPHQWEEIERISSKYIQQINSMNYGGLSDWRIPTLEEAMSLMEAEDNDNGLFISSIFESKQRFIITADQETPYTYWKTYFNAGYCDWEDYPPKESFFIRAVCSGTACSLDRA